MTGKNIQLPAQRSHRSSNSVSHLAAGPNGAIPLAALVTNGQRQLAARGLSTRRVGRPGINNRSAPLFQNNAYQGLSLHEILDMAITGAGLDGR